jgi:hypothetical protein
MNDYRLYLLQNDRMSRAEAFEVESDSAAIARSETLRGEQSAELWNRARIVTRFQANPGPHAPPPSGE